MFSAVVETRRGVLRRALTAWAGSSAGVPLLIGTVRASGFPPIAVWKDANCGCCEGWVQHMRQAGFNVMVRDTDNMEVVKRARGVPDSLWSCHTAVIEGYVIEGHVPSTDVVRLLEERPMAKGLAVPGMPASAPGMEQSGEPYSVVLFGAPDGERTYAKH